MKRPVRSRLLVAALALLAACTDTNLTGSDPGAGGWVVFASDREDANFEIFRVGADGRGLRRLTRNVAQTDLAPRLSPDGRRIAWEREIGLAGGGIATQLWVMNVDGSGQRVVVDNGAENRSPAWASDDALVYASYLTGNWEIFRVPLDGGEAENLTNNPFADQFPRVSPDGSRILFHSNREFNFDIYVMDADGSNPRNLTDTPAHDDRFADWTPDGTRIVWSPFTTTFDLYEMSADGEDARPLLATSFAERHPSVSPDGRLVVFQSDRRAPFGLFVMEIGGGEPRPLIDGESSGASEIDPQWGR